MSVRLHYTIARKSGADSRDTILNSCFLACAAIVSPHAKNRTGRAPGLPHHVTQRGNRRQETFFCEGDYEEYIRLISAWCSRWNVQVRA